MVLRMSFRRSGKRLPTGTLTKNNQKALRLASNLILFRSGICGGQFLLKLVFQQKIPEALPFFLKTYEKALSSFSVMINLTVKHNIRSDFLGDRCWTTAVTEKQESKLTVGGFFVFH